MAQNPKFDSQTLAMKTLHDKKNHDYASNSNPYSNFEEAAAFAGTSVDTVFKVMMGIKMARLNELQAGQKVPNNESVNDSIMDLAMYAALWSSYRGAYQGYLPASGDASSSATAAGPRVSLPQG